MNYSGCEGVITLDDETLLELTSFNIDQNTNALDNTIMDGSCNRRVKAGQKSWSGTIDIFYDPESIAQEKITNGALIGMKFYPEGVTNISGNGLITNISIPIETDGMITQSITFEGTSTLDLGTTKILINNILNQWSSSENLLSGSWQTFSNLTIDQTKKNTLLVTGNGNLRVNLDQEYTKGDVFTIAFDASTNVVGDFSVTLIDNFTAPSAAVIIPIDSTKRRYAATIDSSGIIGSTVGVIQFGFTNYVSGSELIIERVTVENVTGRTTTNPSTYIPKSVSVQLNGHMEQADNSVPSLTVANGCPTADDKLQDLNTTNDGWCWGLNTAWSIAGNALSCTGAFQSIHSKQFGIEGRTYNYQFTISVTALLSVVSIAGTPAPGSSVIGTHTGSVIAQLAGGGDPQLFVTTSGTSPGSTITKVSIVELNQETLIDGAVMRSSYGDTTVDPITYIVTE